MTWTATLGLVVMASAVLSASPQQATSPQQAASPQKSQPRSAVTANQICASCHGPKGNSPSSAFPKLAGQQKDYLVAQLKAFRDRTRADPMAQAYMWGMASQLTDDAIADLASYFAAQKATRGKQADVTLVQQGRDIFEHGIAAENVQACMACHGPHAEGNGIIPRLADQHAEYVLKQLALFKTQVRTGANAPLMHAVTGGMTFEQMTAVAAFLSRSEQ